MSKLGLIGNPENRRIQHFSDACVEQGHDRPICLSYEDILSDPTCLESFQAQIVRVDSPGENDKVARALIALGGGPEPCSLEFGQVAYLQEFHRGYCKLLQRLGECSFAFANAPSEIALMFDKWACHRRFLEKGVARPEAWLGPANFELFREQFSARSGRFFLKPLHGSSASGVCALRWSGERYVMQCPLQWQDGRMFNSLQVQRYERLEEIERILNALLPVGMIVEQWIPKWSVHGGAVDVRVLVVEGVARQRVGRRSRHPVTNLHLGNCRMGEEEIVAQLGEAKWDRVLRLAERAALCFPASLSVGVDVLIDTFGRPWVGEVNAFGDLLPRLSHQGETAYQTLAKALYEKV